MHSRGNSIPCYISIIPIMLVEFRPLDCLENPEQIIPLWLENLKLLAFRQQQNAFPRLKNYINLIYAKTRIL